MSIKGICRLLFALICAAFSAQPALTAPAPSLVGYWYGLGEPNDPGTYYIDWFHADGRFSAEYRKCDKGKVVFKQTAAGTWKLAKDVLTISVTLSDGKPTRWDQVYTMESLTPTEFQARYQENDFLFIEIRIPTFDFPACYVIF